MNWFVIRVCVFSRKNFGALVVREGFLIKIMLKVKSVAKLVLRCKSHDGSIFSKELLCSESNKTICIAKMQTALPKMLKSSETRRKNQKHAAVLIPIVTSSGSDELSLLYTLRSRKMTKHTGQVAFPGWQRLLLCSSACDWSWHFAYFKVGFETRTIHRILTAHCEKRRKKLVLNETQSVCGERRRCVILQIHHSLCQLLVTLKITIHLHFK